MPGVGPLCPVSRRRTRGGRVGFGSEISRPAAQEIRQWRAKDGICSVGHPPCTTKLMAFRVHDVAQDAPNTVWTHHEDDDLSFSADNCHHNLLV